MKSPLEFLGAALAIVGAVLIACRINVYVGFWHFLASSIFLMWWALRCRLTWIFSMQFVFFVVNIIGIVRWRH